MREAEEERDNLREAERERGIDREREIERTKLEFHHAKQTIHHVYVFVGRAVVFDLREGHLYVSAYIGIFTHPKSLKCTRVEGH